MAGRPRRRERLRRLDEALGSLEPLPPDATPEQQHERARAFLRVVRKVDREQLVRRGKASPRTHGEIAIFGSDLVNRRPDDGEDSRA